MTEAIAHLVVDGVEVKPCSRCNELKSLDQFGKRTSSADGLSFWCKECTNKHFKSRYADGRWQSWRDRNPEKAKEVEYRARLKYKYGITPEQLEEIRIKQENKCTICRREVPLHIDHNHKTKKFRGLLCEDCNRSLVGTIERFGIELVIRAIEYLEAAQTDSPEAQEIMRRWRENNDQSKSRRVPPNEV